MVPLRLRGWQAALALLLGALPIVIGFLGPALYLAVEAWERVRFAGVSPAIWRATINTVSMSAVATVVVLFAGFAVAYAVRLRPGSLTGPAELVA
jgi:iron(III) transport system permease protein